MIKTISEIRETEGFEVGQKQVCDKWFGTAIRQWHITAITFVEDNAVTLKYDEYINRHVDDSKKQHVDLLLYAFADDHELIWADTEEQMNEDYLVLKDKHTYQREQYIERAVDSFKSWVDMYYTMDHEMQVAVRKAIKEAEGDNMMMFQWDLPRFQKEKDKLRIEDDDVYLLSDIYLTHTVKFKDIKRGSIDSRIDLSKAKCVTSGNYSRTDDEDEEDDRDNAIAVEIGDDIYHIFYKDNEDLYRCLCALYGFKY